MPRVTTTMTTVAAVFFVAAAPYAQPHDIAADLSYVQRVDDRNRAEATLLLLDAVGDLRDEWRSTRVLKGRRVLEVRRVVRLFAAADVDKACIPGAVIREMGWPEMAIRGLSPVDDLFEGWQFACDDERIRFRLFREATGLPGLLDEHCRPYAGVPNAYDAFGFDVERYSNADYEADDGSLVERLRSTVHVVDESTWLLYRAVTVALCANWDETLAAALAKRISTGTRTNRNFAYYTFDPMFTIWISSRSGHLLNLIESDVRDGVERSVRGAIRERYEGNG